MEKIIADFQARLDAIKAEAAGVRDKLRDLIQDAEGLSDSFTNATEELENAKRSLEDAADQMSQYV